MNIQTFEPHNRDEYDIVIVGGGLVGASLAVAIQPCQLRTLVIESLAPDSLIQPSYDERTVALTDSTRRIFVGMDIWHSIDNQQVESIKDIHISNKGYFGMTHLSHRDIGTDALGYVVPTRVIGQILWQHINESNFTEIACPANAVSMKAQEHSRSVEIYHSENRRNISGKLIVIADGGRSSIGQQAFIDSQSHQYSQTAVLSIVSTDRDHRGRAYERFTSEGPLALLPSGKKRYAVVWTTSESHLVTRLSLNDNEFIDHLQVSFGDRAGNFSHPSKRKSYPLKLERIARPIGHRVVVIGNAAHTIHPIAGQGFNLGLRDVATLAEIICDTSTMGTELGSADMLHQYMQLRQRDTKMVSCFSHSLIEIFSNKLKTIGLLRNLGLTGIESSLHAKRFLLKKTMGLSGQQTRLTAGLSVYG